MAALAWLLLGAQAERAAHVAHGERELQAIELALHHQERAALGECACAGHEVLSLEVPGRNAAASARSTASVAAKISGASRMSATCRYQSAAAATA